MTSTTSILGTHARSMACALSSWQERALDRLEYNVDVYMCIYLRINVCVYTHTHTNTHRSWQRGFQQINDICEAIERRLLQVSCAHARAHTTKHTHTNTARAHTHTHNQHTHKFKTHTNSFPLLRRFSASCSRFPCAPCALSAAWQVPELRVPPKTRSSEVFEEKVF